ncbi:hypothetical protein JAAARDRAFT_59382 [Jaapia argillacea MUCL 33604]|uniref:RING-CH-type domain-containing protein n=1 Tax=Jaapia argillacea MUCL 33604 TaxID=933084 RepID=A0A067Q022_9AGAM|nr:hypothetical protein JAAARDRAFT_59382 [Jaapia argillacea MUCL 33604]
MTDANTRRVPTVNDLRVKECYICREEERHDQPTQPPRAWVHPCSCTLIAHESCLLHWISTSQSNARSGSSQANALKCPQCGSKYELVSDRPWTLKLLDVANRALSVGGRVVSVGAVGVIVCSFGAGIYLLCTAYGAFAVQEFLGKEMYDLFLTDDPSNWPWHAFINLPIIPLSMIASRISLVDSNFVPIIPLFLVWPTSPPVHTPQRLFATNWSNGSPYASAPGSSSLGGLDHNINPFSLLMWPPAPLLGCFLYPLTQRIYRHLFSRFSHWVLDKKEGARGEEGRVRGVVWEGWEGAPMLQIRINARIEGGEEGQQGQGQGGEQGQGQAQAQVQAGVDEAGVAQAAVVEGEGAEPDDAVAAAERMIRVSGASIGRAIGGALILPLVANYMGSLLYRLARYSPLLRKFLAIKSPLAFRGPDALGLAGLGGGGAYGGAWVGRREVIPAPLGAASGDGYWKGMTPAKSFLVGCKLALGVFLGGTRTWAECDPAWWRNSIGLGIFVFAKDCLQLFHLWLTKRELESRRVKNKSFEGVEVSSLDLIEAWNRR